MREEAVLITGANGEIGHGLIGHLSKGNCQIIALDLNPLDAVLESKVNYSYVGDILDKELLKKVFSAHKFCTIYHLASILSTKAEHNPELAHRINVEGTLNLLQLATEQSRQSGRPVKFIYPSSIAGYGLPDLTTKKEAGKVREDQFNAPSTMYGVNKLYCENLGRYYSKYYRQLTNELDPQRSIDFRSIRFPGLISAQTMPTGGTSDYGPEMLHAAAKAEEYACFVRPDAVLPFMVMPDAVKSLIQLEAADRNRLTQTVYNVTSFNPSAQEIYDITIEAFPNARIAFAPDAQRQGIVDSWPADIDDSAARHDWDWQPDYDIERAFKEYLIPSIRERYK
ncbi:MAG: NAD-dependent epimerase/dehydratase family protein [Anaerolineaceae bacterium]|jgi:threonine 3-dehydrogenase